MRSFEEKCELLRRRFQELESAVVAFSGGVDSAVLVAVAHTTLGERMIALQGVSPSVPRRDRELSAAFCTTRRIPFQEIPTTEFSDPQYVANPDNRCYFCKHNLFELLHAYAKVHGFRYVVEGTNASDLCGHRPGMRAAEDHDVISPLLDLGFLKDDVRRLARNLGLEIADKPSTACLSSRVSTGIPIDPKLLLRIDTAENAIRDLGIRQVRVRHHGDIARIEVPNEELETAFVHRARIDQHLRDLGWKSVSLDLAGYKTR